MRKILFGAGTVLMFAFFVSAQNVSKPANPDGDELAKKWGSWNSVQKKMRTSY